MSNLLYKRLAEHAGHNVQINKYGIGEGYYSLECKNCDEVILDTDLHDIKYELEDIKLMDKIMQACGNFIEEHGVWIVEKKNQDMVDPNIYAHDYIKLESEIYQIISDCKLPKKQNVNIEDLIKNPKFDFGGEVQIITADEAGTKTVLYDSVESKENIPDELLVRPIVYMSVNEKLILEV